MSVDVKKLRGKFRIVEEGTRRLARSKNGEPMDGGGHAERAKALRQEEHINAAARREA